MRKRINNKVHTSGMRGEIDAWVLLRASGGLAVCLLSCRRTVGVASDAEVPLGPKGVLQLRGRCGVKTSD